MKEFLDFKQQKQSRFAELDNPTPEIPASKIYH